MLSDAIRFVNRTNYKRLQTFILCSVSRRGSLSPLSAVTHAGSVLYTTQLKLREEQLKTRVDRST